MLSVSKLLANAAPQKEGLTATEAGRYLRQTRPVVVWNVTRSCNLFCAHCYNDSGNGAYEGELTAAEALSVIDGLSDFKVPAVIFSGGDPLLRPDIFKLMERASSLGIRPVLSTNGISIDKTTARRARDAGVVYAGVSLDGNEGTNDRLRGMRGGFKKALEGIRNLKEAGLVAGVRFTMSRTNIAELPFIFDLIEKEDIERGYFAHLVYAGRGERLSREDLSHDQTRKAVDFIFSKAGEFISRGLDCDIVTGSNDADGVYLYLRLSDEDPERAAGVYTLLAGRGGNSSGVSLANIDNLGYVHPDQFWTGRSFGNVKDRPFGEIWTDLSDPLLKALRNRKGLVKGRCARCAFFEICGGSYRVRAEFATGDIWAQDPACYLTDREIGIA